MRHLRLLCALLALVVLTTTAPALAAPAATITVAAPGGTVVTSQSAFRFVGVDVAGTGLTGTSVDLTLDGTVVRTLPVQPDGTASAGAVTFPAITLGEHTLALRRGTTTLASTKILVTFDPLEVVPRPVWITAEKLRDEGVELAGEKLPSRGNFVAQVGPFQREAQADVNGRLSVTFKDPDGELAAPGLYRAGVYEQPGSDPNRVSYRNLRVTVLDAVTRERGSVVQGTGFTPTLAVELVVDGRVRGTATPDSSGTVRIDSPVTGSVDVTLRAPAGQVTRRLDLVRADELPDGPTDAEVAEAERVAKAAEEVVRSAQVVKERVEEAAVTSGASSSRAPLPVLMPDGELQRQVDALQTLFGRYPGVTFLQFAGTTVTLDVGTLQSDLVAQANEAFSAYLREVIAALPPVRQTDTAEVLRQLTESMRRIEQAQSQNQGGGWLGSFLRSSSPELLPGAVDADGVATFAVPKDFRGLHHAAVVDPATGLVTVWQPFRVEPATGSGGDADTGAALPDAGAPVGPAWPVVGVLAVLLGAALILVERRRRV